MKHSLENANINVMQTEVASIWEHGFFVRYGVPHFPASPPPHRQSPPPHALFWKRVLHMVKTATVKDVPINNDALLNIQAC